MRTIIRRRASAGFVLLVLVTALDAAGCTRDETAKKGETDAGSPGARNAAPAAVRLDSTAMRLAGIALDTVAAHGDAEVVANGTITYNADRVSVIGPRVEGRIVTVQADLGREVRQGDVLATVESQEIGQIRGEHARALATMDVALRNYEREQRLFRQQISSEREMLEAEAAYRSAQADYNSAGARLKAVGATPDGGGAVYGLQAPMSGIVLDRSANPGQLVGPSSNLFTVAQLEHLWITVDVYESDLSRVRNNAIATVLPRSLPLESFRGRVTYPGGVVDTLSRTFRVRVDIENPQRKLRPGMYAQVRIRVPSTDAKRASAVIPELAVQDLGGTPVVFVPGSAAGLFVARPVLLGERLGSGMVVVTSGLHAGERIVTRGAFQLKAELSKATFANDEP